MTRSCFTYGSLMWADIMSRVCGRPPSAWDASAAWLPGHLRHPVRDQDYPGLRSIEEPSHTPGLPSSLAGRGVAGILYRDLRDEEFQRLDAFEGAEYERVAVTVWLPARPSARASGLEEVSAWVYRFRDEFAERLLPGDWDPDRFEREGRVRFMARYVGFETVGDS